MAHSKKWLKLLTVKSSMESEFKHLKVAVIGLGLIGGSFAMAFKKLGMTVYAIDTNPEILKLATKKQCIDNFSCSVQDVLPLVDITVVALYPELTIKFIQENKFLFKENSLVFDVAGIKEKIVTALSDKLPNGVDFIATHPMAGRESGGFINATSDIFHGANFVIIPTVFNQPENIVLLTKLAKAIGCKNVVQTNPTTHDEIIAYTSNITHVVATALLHSESFSEQTKFFIAGSFKDATRVAKINEILWSELLISNAKAVAQEITRLQNNLEAVKKLIVNEDKPALQKWLKKSSDRRGELI